MGLDKNFVVKNGLEIASDLIFADSVSNKAGIGTTTPEVKLDINGDTSVSGNFRATGIATVGGVFDVGIAGTALRVDNGTGRVGVNTGSPEYNFEVIGNAGISSHFNVGGITTSNILHVTGLTSSVHLNVTGVTTIADARINAGFTTVTYSEAQYLNVTGVATVGGNLVLQDGGLDKITISPSNASILPSVDGTGSVGTTANTWASGRFTNFTVDSVLNVRTAIDLADSDTIRFGTGDDYKVNFDGTNFNINRAVGGNINIQDGGVDKIQIHPSTVAILPSVDNTGVIGNTDYTWSNGRFTNLTVDTILSVRGALDLADNDKIRFGNGDDVRMYYDTSDFLIEIDEGDIIIRDNTTPRFTFGRTTGNLTATGAGIFSGDVSGSTITAGTGGAVSLSTNDGKGNANITFNHKGGVADQDGSAFRITGTTDITDPARLDFNIYENITAGSAGTPSRILRLTPNQATITGNTEVTGIVTALQFVGDGSNLTGIDSSGNFQGKFVVCQGVISTGIGTFGQIKVGIDSVTGNAGTSFITGFTSVTATKFYGDGANLTNTGATLSAASGSQRVVLTSLTSGTMTSAGTDAQLTFDASTNTLSCTNFSGDGANLTNTGATLGASSSTERLVTTSLTSGTMTSAGTDAQLTFDASTNTLNCTNFSGDGSNITNVDAATVDGIDSSAFIRSNAADVVTANTTWNDSNAIRLGTDGDQRIYFNGDNTIFQNINETKGSYYFQGENPSGVNQNSLQLRHDSNDAYVRLFCSNTERLKTTTGGISVTGAGAFSGTVTANTFSGSGASLTSIPNTALDNSTISGVSLGSNLETLTRGNYLTGSDYNGSTTRTWAVDAATGNSAGKVVARDASGNFAAGTINADLNGTATNATNAKIDSETTTNTDRFLVFTDTGGGTNQRLKIDGNLKFNPSTDTLTVANIDGNATTASNATNAGTLDGYDSAIAATGSTVVVRDSDGDIEGRYIIGSYMNMTHGSTSRTSDTVFYSSTDAFVRKNNASGFRTSLNVPTRTGGNASGTWGISISGNAATATSATNAGKLDNIDSSQFLRSDTSDIKSSGDIRFNDNVALKFGTGNDTEMFFDGSQLYLDLNAGSFYIRDDTTTRFTLDDNGDFIATRNIIAGGDFETNTKLKVNNTGESKTLLVGPAGSASDQHQIGSGVNLHIDSATNGTLYLQHYSARDTHIGNGTTKKDCYVGNNLTAGGDITANSDIKLKKNIETLENPIEKVKQLRGVRYDRVDIEKDNCIGVIAQEVEEVYPEFVSEGEDGTKGVDYSKMVAVLIETVKEQQKQIEELKSQINN